MARHTRKPPKGPYDPKKVGYRNPPKKHQFPKGQSGNPRGRPSGSKGLRTDLKQVLGTIRTIVINGKEITGRSQWLMLEALAMRGSHGDLKAIAQLLPLILQVLGIEDQDVDTNRLSAADDAMLDRMMERWGLAGKKTPPKSRVQRRPKRKTDPKARKPGPGTRAPRKPGSGGSDG